MCSAFQRDEVIVQLSEDFDITPILGAHVWQEVLTFGDPKYLKRTSFVFEYNYRIRGHPGSRTSDPHTCNDSDSFDRIAIDGWEEEWPTGGDPNDPRKFPVKFPYPRPHWATTRGKNCADLALSLPQSRVRTPPPPAVSYVAKTRRRSIITSCRSFSCLLHRNQRPLFLSLTRNLHISDRLATRILMKSCARPKSEKPKLRRCRSQTYYSLTSEIHTKKVCVTSLDSTEYAEAQPTTEDAALQFVKQEPVELHIKEEVDIKQETFEPRIKKEHDHLGTRLK